jgi:hypothetical protein
MGARTCGGLWLREAELRVAGTGWRFETSPKVHTSQRCRCTWARVCVQTLGAPLAAVIHVPADPCGPCRPAFKHAPPRDSGARPFCECATVNTIEATMKGAIDAVVARVQAT